MKIYQPMFFTCIKNYSKEQFIKDFVAGLVIAMQGIIRENSNRDQGRSAYAVQ